MTTLDKDDIEGITTQLEQKIAARLEADIAAHTKGEEGGKTGGRRRKLVVVVVLIGVMAGADRFIHLDAITRGAEWLIGAVLNFWWEDAIRLKTTTTKKK